MRLACSALLALAACGTEPTQLVVVVDLDRGAAPAIDRVNITVQGDGDGTPRSYPAPLGGPDAIALPLTLGLVPGRASVDAPVTISAEAWGGQRLVARRTLRTRFVAGASRTVPLALRCGCLTQCGLDERCGAEPCATPDVPPERLAPWTGTATRLDAGAPSTLCTAPDAGCATGRALCGGSCVDPLTSTQHCGRCDAPCGSGSVCIAGRCVTPSRGDHCVTAPDASGIGQYAGNTCEGDDTITLPGESAGVPDRFFRIVVPPGQSRRYTIVPSQFTQFRAVLVPTDCVADGAFVLGLPGNVTLDGGTAGRTYWVMVERIDGGCGAFDLAVTFN